MVDELDFLDDEEEFEDEGEDFAEDDDEAYDYDDFDDDFDDEVGPSGPVYAQAPVSRGFEGIAVVASFAIICLSVFLLWTQVGTPVYDDLLSEPDLTAVDGLGRGGSDELSFAPADVRVIGLGKYDPTSADYEYAMLDAGSDQGLGVGMLFEFDGATLAVVQVEPRSCRADFVSLAAEASETVSVNRMGLASPEYAALANVPVAGTRVEDLLSAGEVIAASDLEQAAARELPPTPPISERLHESLVYEASDGQGRYDLVGHLDQQRQVVSAATFETAAATRLDAAAQEEAGTSSGEPKFGYLYFSANVRARLLPAQEQVLIRPILEAMRQ